MTYAQLTILAEVARSAAEESMEEYAERSYDGCNYATPSDLKELSRPVYDAVMDAGEEFIKPLGVIEKGNQ
jgi:hypothetical protein